MRKIALLCAVFIMSLMYGGTAAESELALNYSFDDLVTNSKSVPFTIKSDVYYIDEYKDKDKGLMCILGGNSAQLEFNASMNKNYLVSFDIMPTGNDFNATVSLKNSSSEWKAVYISGYCLRRYNNSKAGCLNASKPTKVEILVDAAAKSYSIYLDKKPVSVDYYTGNIPENVSGVMINCNADSEGSKVLFDNINIGETDKIPFSYKRAEYTSESTELDLTPPQAGTAVIYKNNFQKNVSGISFTKNDNIWELYNNGEEVGGLLLKKVNSQTSYADIAIPADQYRYLVYETSIKLVDLKSKFIMGIMKSSQSHWCTVMSIENKTVSAMGRSIATLNNTKFTEISLVFDLQNLTYDAYVDGELVQKTASFNLNGSLIQLRMEMSAGSDPCEVILGKYCIYEGKEPRDVFADGGISAPAYDPKKNMFYDYSQQELMCRDYVGYHIRSGVLTTKDERKITEPKGYVKDGRTMLPVRAISEAFNVDVSYDETERKVTIGDTSYFIIGEKKMYVNGTEIPLDTAAEEKDGRTFLPVRAFCENVLNKKVYYDDSAEYSSGMILIGDKMFSAPKDKSELQKLNNYLFYYRPTEDEVYNDFLNTSSGVHPRMHITKESGARLKEKVKTDPIMKSWANSVIAVANNAVDAARPPLEYDISSGRLNYQKAEGLPNVAVAYYLTGDMKYVDYAWYVCEAMCSWDDWYPYHYLDTAIAAGGIATAYDYMYDAFTEEQRKVIEEGLYKNALSESLLWQYGVKSTGPNNSWPYMYNNWNYVCNGNIMKAAISLMDVYPDESKRVLANCIKGLEHAMNHTAPDGAWWEGPVYWNFGTSYLVIGMSALETALGTVYALDTAEGMDKTGAYGINISSKTGSFNYADADEYTTYPDYMYWLANHYHDKALTNSMYKATNGRYISPYAFLFINTDDIEESKGYYYDLQSYFGGETQAVTMRDGWYDDETTFAGFKGGYTSHSHGHMDAGSFVFENGGIRWSADMGVESYSINGFWQVESGKWKILRNRAEGHSTIIINPDGTGIDHTLYENPQVTRLESNEGGVISELDMSGVLSENTTSAKRGFYFTDYRKSLVVRDELKLKGQSDVYWHMYTEASDCKIDGNTAVLSKNGQKLNVEFKTNGNLTLFFEDAAPMEGMPSMPGEKVNTAFKKLRAKITGDGDLNITVKLSAPGNYASEIDKYDIPMSEWTLSDETKPQTAELSEIYVNGKAVEKFNPKDKKLTLTYTMDEDSVPQISAQSSAKTEVIQAKSFDDNTVIKVFSDENPEYYDAYVIGYVGIPKVAQISGYTTYQAKEITASAEPQAENKKENAFDKDFSTRWSAQGLSGVWLMEDLGEVKDVDCVLLAAWQGAAHDGRKMLFDIEVSADGVNYTKVYDGSTSGTTEDLEEFKFERCGARYIKINCRGTTTGDWNSILELVAALKD